MTKQTVWVAAAALVTLAGCAQPRMVTGITVQKDKVRFLYNSSNSFVECRADEQGDLTQCTYKGIIYEE